MVSTAARDAWIQWQIRTDRHGSDRTGEALRLLIQGRWYNMKKWRRAKQATVARRANAAAAAVPPAPAPPAVAAPTAPTAAPAAPIDEEENGDADMSDDVDIEGDAEGDDGVDDESGGRMPDETGDEGLGRGLTDGMEDEERPGTAGLARPASRERERRGFRDDDEEIRNKLEARGGTSYHTDAGEVPEPMGNRIQEEDKSDQDTESDDDDEAGHIWDFNVRDEKRLEKRQKFGLENRPHFEADRERWDSGWEAQGSTLGSGGYGVAYIYCRLDENNAIKDRVVVKDAWMPHENWTAFHKWYGDPRKPNERVPMEIKCMQVIDGRPGSQHCVKIRGEPERDDNELRYRIYMEFCPHKNLHFLIKDRHPDQSGATYHSYQLIPEPALWSIFSDLVDACLLLQFGGVEANETMAGWEPIVHRDIKLDNIFLDRREAKNRFPSYPTARLGDFGVAMMTDENDANNPMAFNDAAGARCWRAPEQLLFVDKSSLRPVGVKLGEKTNVWGIGAVMVRLMSLDPDPVQPDFEDGEPAEPQIRDGWTGSDALEELVKECVAYDPSNRPSLRNVKARILANTTHGEENDEAKGMRGEKHAKGDETLRLHIPSDKYKIGLARSGS